MTDDRVAAHSGLAAEVARRIDAGEDHMAVLHERGLVRDATLRMAVPEAAAMGVPAEDLPAEVTVPLDPLVDLLEVAMRRGGDEIVQSALLTMPRDVLRALGDRRRVATAATLRAFQRED